MAVPHIGAASGAWHDGGVSSSTPPPPSNGASQPDWSASHDPWAHDPPNADEGGDGVRAATGDTSSSGAGPVEVRELLLVALAVAVSGVVLGLLWWLLASPVPYISDGENAFLRHTEGEETVAVDAVYVLLASALGAVSGLLVFLIRRNGGVAVVVGLALGSVLAGLIGWQLGELLGPSGDLAARAADVGRGETFEGPLRLHSTVGLLVWPLVALLVHLIITTLFGPRDPEPEKAEDSLTRGRRLVPPARARRGPTPTSSDPVTGPVSSARVTGPVSSARVTGPVSSGPGTTLVTTPGSREPNSRGAGLPTDVRPELRADLAWRSSPSPDGVSCGRCPPYVPR